MAVTNHFWPLNGWLIEAKVYSSKAPIETATQGIMMSECAGKRPPGQKHTAFLSDIQ